MAWLTTGGSFAPLGSGATVWYRDDSNWAAVHALPTYTVAGLPSASSVTRGMVYVSNGGNNLRLAVSDGTNWRWTDGNIVGTDPISAAGTVGTVTSGTLSVTGDASSSFITLTFTLTAARIPVTDGGASGSYGSVKIFDFVEAGIAFLGCRQNYTAFVEGATLTTGAGDAVHRLGIGTAAITTARDGTLTGNEQNVGNLTGAITNVAGTGAGTIFTGPVSAAIDGTATAADLYLNWSGTAATIDANSTIDVTGTITVVCAFLGDD